MHGYHGWENPRFEDFEYESWLPEDDPLAYLGNGQTVAEKTDVGDTTGYMDFENVEQVLVVPQPGVFPEPPDHPSLAALKATGELGGLKRDEKPIPLVPSAASTNGVNGNGHVVSQVNGTKNEKANGMISSTVSVVTG